MGENYTFVSNIAYNIVQYVVTHPNVFRVVHGDGVVQAEYYSSSEVASD